MRPPAWQRSLVYAQGRAEHRYPSASIRARGWLGSVIIRCQLPWHTWGSHTALPALVWVPCRTPHKPGTHGRPPLAHLAPSLCKLPPMLNRLNPPASHLQRLRVGRPVLVVPAGAARVGARPALVAPLLRARAPAGRGRCEWGAGSGFGGRRAWSETESVDEYGDVGAHGRPGAGAPAAWVRVSNMRMCFRGDGRRASARAPVAPACCPAGLCVAAWDAGSYLAATAHLVQHPEVGHAELATSVPSRKASSPQSVCNETHAPDHRPPQPPGGLAASHCWSS